MPRGAGGFLFSAPFAVLQQDMPRWIWLVLLLYGLVMAMARVIGLRDLAIEDALVARDFSNVFIAAKMLCAGTLEALYDVEAYGAQSWRWIGTHWGNNYSYPPHSLFLVAPFGLLNYPAAILGWNIGSLALFSFAARHYLPDALPWWAATFSPAALICLVFGHYGLLIGALWLLAFRGSGTAAAIMTIKPHLGLMIFVRALFDQRMFIVVSLVSIALIGASFLVFGADLWTDYFAKTARFQFDIALSGSQKQNMITPFSAFGPLLYFAFAIPAAWLLTRRFDVFTAATATFLIVPYGMHYDMTVVCLGVAALLASAWERLSIIERMVLILAFLSPALVRASAMLAPPLLLGALYLQVRHADAIDRALPTLWKRGGGFAAQAGARSTQA